MASTDGGVILLGVRELPDGHLEAAGISDIGRVQKALCNGLNNRQQVRQNILSSSSVETIDNGGKRILRITVPRAARRQRPVHAAANPLDGIYRRNHEGDYRGSAQDVRRILPSVSIRAGKKGDHDEQQTLSWKTTGLSQRYELHPPCRCGARSASRGEASRD